MKNAFDAKGNFGDWIQNDWESDDYIENSNRRNPAPSYNRSTGAEEKPEALHWFLAILITLATSPLFWIAILVLGFWIEK